MNTNSPDNVVGSGRHLGGELRGLYVVSGLADRLRVRVTGRPFQSIDGELGSDSRDGPADRSPRPGR